jgi:hypothetical protein
VRRQKSGSFGFAEGSALCVGAKPNVPLAGWQKIVFKKCGWEKNKKHRVGNECRLTRCPFVISFLCLWLSVKMVYFFLVLSLLFVVAGSSLTLAANVLRVGDDALCCACGKAILLTRCYEKI